MKVLARSFVLMLAVATQSAGLAQQCEQRLQASDASMGDRFGGAVALDGDTMVIGAYSGQLSNSGAAYVFERTPTGWVETEKLLGPQLAHAFGGSVAIEGNTAVIGSPADFTQGFHAGAVYVFERRATGWQPPEQLLASNGGAMDFFGKSVSFSGDRIVIGAGGVVTMARVYVFERTPNGWVETQELLGVFPDDEFGRSVSLHGDQAVIGAPQQEIPGRAYVFEREPSGWVETQELHAPGANSDRFGESVSISKTNVVVGAPRHDDLGVDSGAAYIFERTATQWVQIRKVLAFDGETDDLFGSSVAIQSSTALVGAAQRNIGAQADPGAAYAVDFPCAINYCTPAIPNSTGLPGIITATGSPVVVLNDVTLTADQLPLYQFGYFLASRTQGFFNPPGSDGFICLGGAIGRYNQPQNIGQGPAFSIQVDLTAVPQPTGPVAVQPGETWNFQCWHRDLVNSNNFTDGVSILFQ